MRNPTPILTSLLFAALLPGCLQADDGRLLPVYRIDKSHSYLGFQVSHLGFTHVRGTFNRWSGAIAYDRDAVERSSVTVMIETASIDTGNESRDRDLRSPHFFDAEGHPLIFFQSTRVERRDAGFVAHGVMAIKGTARQVAIPFEPAGSIRPQAGDERIAFTARWTLLRADYGVVNTGNVLENRGVIGKQVTIELEVAAQVRNFAEIPFSQWSSKPSAGERLMAVHDQGGIEAMLEQFRAWQAEPPSELNTSDREVFIAAARLLRHGDVSDALRLVGAVAETRPDSLDACLRLAATHLAAGDRAAAREAYLRARELDPHSSVAVERLRQLDGLLTRATLLPR